MKPSKWATDHRAIVLEAIATSPVPPRLADVIEDAQSMIPDFKPHPIRSMMWQLEHEGLIGRTRAPLITSTRDTYHITKAGLDWLASGRFDRALPSDHTRPRAQGKKSKKRLA